ncbi:MAG: FtsX-like permease family protein [Chlorobium sp.]|jgi:putative ABC transport system permease protein|uniref:ABC transporter permease n=1 Tax=Chlorobium sp. TaxID=1095 RepID=UPI001D59DC31|nr:ABC transporter permease [Chlorobium sp.]MBN1279277.1 FtsX-like permease family protein [Chlorobiaceae bacterium]MCF8216243.1 FtsX-like permease family protein [Chlorobium sp.]MCF8271145.1 FtsX-like permease family protein [Chlorobium sp.]MCF8287519.1 FtsX-like permease family protein [Chlorobium sp.]MCF8291058.1 FtsX-like permease family protein [Chlorobium sp.]
MNLLAKKMLRELLHLKGQMLAVAAVVACGISVFVSMSSVKYSLEASREQYYSTYRFSDVFLQVKRAPEFYREVVSRIPGVASVNSRIVADVTLDVPGLDEPATGRLISIPEYRTVPVLNDLYIERGRYIEPGNPEEVIASKPFLEANGLSPGDRISAVINGRKKQLVIVGMGLSPEYIYEVQPGSFFPDKRRFGVFWMSRRALESALDMSGAFNDLTLTLAHGASEKDIIMRLDTIFRRYGSLGAYGRSEQLSDRFIVDEIKQVGIQITFLPAVFLAVAVFLLNMVLRRIVATQRDQIAVLKAMGFSNEEVGFHYLGFAMVPTAVGAFVGTLLGVWLGRELMNIYADFYNFAELVYLFRFEDVILAVLLSLAAALIGALGAVRGAVQLPPAEAMRPDSPVIFKHGVFDRPSLRKKVSVPVRIILRNLERRPWKAALSALMISLAVAILIAGRYTYDAVDRMVQVEFNAKHREDVTVVFKDPMPPSVAYTIASFSGILEHEYYREEPVRMRFGHRMRRQSVKGLQSSNGLQRLVDKENRQVELPTSGILLTSELAGILGVKQGDMLGIEFLQGRQQQREVRVAGTIDEILGLSAYMHISELDSLAGDAGVFNAAYLRIDKTKAGELYSDFKSIPGVGSIMMLQALKESFDELIAESMMTSTFILTSFACVLAFAVVYNGARISLSERARELVSLRVLGMTRAEISFILLGEQALLTLFSIPPGFFLGIGLSSLLAIGLSSELYRLPLVFSPYNFLFAFVVVVLVSAVSAAVVRRRLVGLDLVEVLKTRE